jgi:hypothetical protein
MNCFVCRIRLQEEDAFGDGNMPLCSSHRYSILGLHLFIANGGNLEAMAKTGKQLKQLDDLLGSPDGFSINRTNLHKKIADLLQGAER